MNELSSGRNDDAVTTRPEILLNLNTVSLGVRNPIVEGDFFSRRSWQKLKAISIHGLHLLKILHDTVLAFVPGKVNHPTLCLTPRSGSGIRAQGIPITPSSRPIDQSEISIMCLRLGLRCGSALERRVTRNLLQRERDGNPALLMVVSSKET